MKLQNYLKKIGQVLFSIWAALLMIIIFLGILGAIYNLLMVNLHL
jgi:hypothetical protein